MSKRKRDCNASTSTTPFVGDRRQSVTKGRQFLTSRASPLSNPERIDSRASEALARAAHDLGNKPLIVLTHCPKWRMAPDLPEPIAFKLEKLSQDLQATFLRLSTAGSQQIATRAGHYIQRDEPRLVVEAIRRAIAAARTPSK